MKLNHQEKKSALYDRLAKIIEMPSARTVGIQQAPKVSISNAKITDNSFYSERDGRIVSNWRITGSFIRAAVSDAPNQNSFEVQGVISSIKEVLTRDGESTGGYDLKLINVGYGNRVSEITLRFDDKAAVDYINNNYNPGDLVTICGQIVYDQTTRTVEREVGFGDPMTTTYTNTVRLLKITAGSVPTDGEEGGYPLKDLQGVLVAQNNDIVEKYNARAQVTAATNKAAGANLLF